MTKRSLRNYSKSTLATAMVEAVNAVNVSSRSRSGKLSAVAEMFSRHIESELKGHRDCAMSVVDKLFIDCAAQEMVLCTCAHVRRQHQRGGESVNACIDCACQCMEDVL